MSDDLQKAQDKWEQRDTESKKYQQDREKKQTDDKTKEIECIAVTKKLTGKMTESGINASQFDYLIAKGVSPDTLELIINENIIEAEKKKATEDSEKDRKQQCNLILEKYKIPLEAKFISTAFILGMVEEGITPAQLEDLIAIRLFEKDEEQKEVDAERTRIENCKFLIDRYANDLKNAKMSRVMLESLVYFKKTTPENLEIVIKEKLAN